MPDLEVKGIKFKWGETSFGRNRGISIHRVGVQDDQHVYKFSPNPHDDPFYNKNQGKWYSEAAGAIAEQIAGAGAWPENGAQIPVHGTDYTLELQ